MCWRSKASERSLVGTFGTGDFGGFPFSWQRATGFFGCFLVVGCFFFFFVSSSCVCLFWGFLWGGLFWVVFLCGGGGFLVFL